MNKITDEIFEGILGQVRKPGRYLGNEWNVVQKDFADAQVKFAICFPDLYEVGMSNLGLRIIYGLLNSRPGLLCERVFLPDTDMREILKKSKIPLFSLESKTALREFDFIGFSLSYELDYTNVLGILELAGIPLLARERDESFPLVIAGGSCVGNPEPLADFIDLFLIGEAEEALLEIVEIYRKHQVAGIRYQVTKEDILRELAKVAGVYVPSLYEVEYSGEGAVKKFSARHPDIPLKARKRIVNDLNSAYYPTQWLVPYVSIVHDRAAVELMRGCPHRCNFCQARNIYHSLRLRSPEKVLELANALIRSSGYEEISFLGLSASDYPYLSKVISSVNEEFCAQAIGISLPSLRPKSYFGELANYLSPVRKTTLTFAPEAGSNRLRDALNKNFRVEELYEAVSAAYRSGWQAIKLYFMIGLPGEDYSDLDAILAVAEEVSNLRKKVSRSRAVVRLSIAFFIPKPHTAFEREPMDSAENLRKKALYLRKASRAVPKTIKLNFHNLESSLLEAVLSRGSRELGRVILTAYKKGSLCDGWPEHFRYEHWVESFRECGLDMELYFGRKQKDGILPWSHIDML
jgi:radical SAM family uncharacterized protein